MEDKGVFIMTVENVLFYLDEFTFVVFWVNEQQLISGYVCDICDRLKYYEYKVQRIIVRDNIVNINGYKYV